MLVVALLAAQLRAGPTSINRLSAAPIQVKFPLDVKQIKKLIQSGVNPNRLRYKIDQWVTPEVVMYADPNMVNFLFSHGASRTEPYKTDIIGILGSYHDVHIKGMNSDPEATARILLKYGSDLNDGPPKHQTPLWGAVFQNNTPIVKLFLKLGANPNLVVENEPSALQLATQRRYWTQVNLLLDHKADPNRLTRFDGSGFQMAVWYGNLDIAKRMLSLGADVNLKNIDRQNALHIAASAGRPDMVKLLMRYRPDTKALDSYGRTPAQAAIAMGHPEIAKLMG